MRPRLTKFLPAIGPASGEDSEPLYVHRVPSSAPQCGTDLAGAGALARPLMPSSPQCSDRGHRPDRGHRSDRGRRRVRRPVRVDAVVIALGALALLACSANRNGPAGLSTATAGPATSHPARSPAPSSSGAAAPPRTALLVAAGDIACNPLDRKYGAGKGEETGCRQRATSDLIAALHPAAVMPLGDTQYQYATMQGYLSSYGPTWGRFSRITHPVVGDHEYLTPNAAGYFTFFGRAAGDPRKGYYSYDLGRWHIVVLNDGGCGEIGGCGAGSPQGRWLRTDLAAHRTRCTLAAWHEPRFSSGAHGSNPAFEAMWSDLYAGGVEMVLAGHDHDYERFQPLDAHGAPDSKHGVREFVVGTGGVGLRGFTKIAADSVIRQSDTFGVLALTLRPTSYDWKFAPVGNRFHDSGHATCH